MKVHWREYYFLIYVLKHILITALTVSMLAACAGWYGWAYLSATDDAELMERTLHLPIPILQGAIHYAIGRGMGVTHHREEGFSELEAFLTGKIRAIPKYTYPKTEANKNTVDHYFFAHYYLIGYLGIIFRLFGISVHSLRIACLLLHVICVLAVYGIFRLAMPWWLGFLMALFLAGSHAYLSMTPSLRDFSKAPFILLSLFFMGRILLYSRSPKNLWIMAALMGIIVGIGYGFRQDVYVCIPPCWLCYSSAPDRQVRGPGGQKAQQVCFF